MVPFLILGTVYLYGSSTSTNFEQANDDNSFGFVSADCWFIPDADLPPVECYYMLVPENHAHPDRGTIRFPVVVFRSDAFFTSKSPILHLGAGGPGAPMYLDYTESIKVIWENHDDISVNQGRDLFIIDPRGTGLSEPLLTCDTYVENVLGRLQRNLTIEQEWLEADQDYYDCIDRFKSQGIDLSSYNSLSIAFDIEMMRKAARVDKWILIGVSYGATYAQLIAKEYPGSIEAMILDSATFPNLKSHHNFIERTLAPYEALYGYCEINSNCDAPIPNFKQRMWKLHQELNENPLEVEIASLKIVLNGERFFAAISEGIYGETIFEDIPDIITELEQGESRAIRPYLEDHVSYLLDPSYGDVSTLSHYCYEDKAFIDFDLMRRLADELPEGYIRSMAILAIDWPDYCDRMEIEPGNPELAEATKTNIPSLFLHGELDTITPLSDVISQKSDFKNSQIVTFNLSHDILSSSECAEYIAAEFVDDNMTDVEKISCEY